MYCPSVEKRAKCERQYRTSESENIKKYVEEKNCVPLAGVKIRKKKYESLYTAVILVLFYTVARVCDSAGGLFFADLKIIVFIGL